jgi:hypothetical protein
MACLSRLSVLSKEVMDLMKPFYLILRKVAVKVDVQERETIERVPPSVLRATAYMKW